MRHTGAMRNDSNDGPRLTEKIVRLLETMLRNRDRELWPYAVMREAGLPAGVVYPALDRLTESGWLEVRVAERVNATKDGERLQTRMYRVSSDRLNDLVPQVAAARQFHQERAAASRKRKRSRIPLPVLLYPRPMVT